MIKRTPISPFSATITLGLELGYSKKKIEEVTVIKYIQKLQNELIKQKSIYLSASVHPTNIVLSGQNEPHLVIHFINYPKFELEPKILKEEIENFTKQLMKKFQQNRVVIEYLDETVMFEQNPDEIDGGIGRP